MKGRPRSLSVPALAIRANAGTLKNARAQIVFVSEGPRACAIATTKTSDGNAIKTSSIRMRIESTILPR